MSSEEIAAVIKKKIEKQTVDAFKTKATPVEEPTDFDLDKYLASKGVVASDDLARIAIFATGLYSGPQWLRSIWGTVRNDLSQPVERVQLRALIYDASGQLIATKEFALHNSRFDSRVPVIFNEQVVFNNLPFGYRCSVQVIEAHYVQP
jgi:hypothetical protein